MEIRLAHNIRAFRKQRAVTQEQLAEVLGVSTGAVYKWEADLSIPELELILEMADFFDTSVDVLLGYEMRDNRLEASISRLWELNSNKDRAGLAEAEKALKKYPHNLQVVSAAAFIYRNIGMEDHNRSLLMRALELMEASLILFDQNTDPMGDKIIVYQNMASVYVELEEIDKAIEILRCHNPLGIFNHQLGLILSVKCRDHQSALPCLSHSLLIQIEMLFNTIMGFAHAFYLRGDYLSAKDVLQWGMDCLQGLKRQKGPSYIDKISSLLNVCLAGIQLRTDDPDTASATLSKALTLAEKFDADPNYGPDSYRFVTKTEWTFSAVDSFGKKATESLEKLVELIGDKELTSLWKNRSEMYLYEQACMGTATQGQKSNDSLCPDETGELTH